MAGTEQTEQTSDSPQQQSVRSQMEERVSQLVAEGKLQHVNTQVQNEGILSSRMPKDGCSIFTEIVDIYTAPPTPMKDNESTMGGFREKYLGSVGSLGMRGGGRRVDEVSITRQEKLGEVKITEKKIIKKTMSVTKTDQATEPVSDPKPEIQIEENPHSHAILSQTTIRVFPSVERAQLYYQRISGELPYKAYSKALERARRREIMDRVRAKFGLPPKKKKS